MRRSHRAAFIAAVILSFIPTNFAGVHGTISGASARSGVDAVSPSTQRQHQAYAVMAKPGNRAARQPRPKFHAARKKHHRAARNAAARKRIATRAMTVAKKMNTVGWCYKGVSTALRPLGIELTGMAAYEAKGQLLQDRRFRPTRFRGVDGLRPGDILVHGASAAHPYGHIAVYLGNQNEASDHVQSVVIGGGYGGMTVFRYGTDS